MEGRAAWTYWGGDEGDEVGGGAKGGGRSDSIRIGEDGGGDGVVIELVVFILEFNDISAGFYFIE